MSSTIELVKQIISLLIASLVIYKFAFPILKKMLEDRYMNLIRSSVSLEGNLKKMRLLYEDANFKYLDSLQHKLKWMDFAEIELKKKLIAIYNKHEETLEKITQDYNQQLNELEKMKTLSCLDDMLLIISHSLSLEKIDYNKLVETIA
jgi:F0F1-type ATP synthase membrane subunit b/b'